MNTSILKITEILRNQSAKILSWIKKIVSRLNTIFVNSKPVLQRMWITIIWYTQLVWKYIVRLSSSSKKIFSVRVKPLYNEPRVTFRFAHQGWNYVVDFFLKLQIRIKLSLIVAVSIIATTVIIGTIVTQLQEREARLQTESLGHSIILGLNSSAKDNLLLNSPSVIQDYVNNFINLKLPGLEHLFVIDRQGVIVANLNPSELNKRVSSKEWDIITRTDTSTLIETPTSFRFVQAIMVNKREGNSIRKIIIGGASISFSKEVLLAPINEVKSKIFLNSFAVSLIAISLVFYVSKHFVRIIIVLSNAARKVGSGDLKVNVVTKMKDELGMLSNEFNFMVLQIREKVEMQKFVSKTTVEMISSGKELTLGGSRSDVCAMFTDIRGFTSFSENHSPEEVVETLNYYLDLQTRVIHEHSGVVDKFLGDGIMAIFRNERMILNAIEASIHIQKEIASLNTLRREQNEVVLNVGVGLATGVAVLGSIGSYDRMDFTAIGDTINLSSRLCGIAGPMEIYVTDEIARSIKETFASVSKGNLPIKGKKQDVPVYKIFYELN
jgi:adenylate cyclase